MEFFDCLNERISVEYGVKQKVDSAFHLLNLNSPKIILRLRALSRGMRNLSITALREKQSGFNPSKRCFLVESIPFPKILHSAPSF